MWLRRLVLVLVMAVGAAQAASAQQMDDILKRGKILIGIDLNSPPYGFQDEAQTPSGSEVETAQMIAKDLGVALEIVPTTVANRVPFLATHRVDAVMASFAITPERAKSVWFSTPYGTTGSIVIAPKSVAIRGYPDLDGKKIATTRGSAAELALGTAVTKGTQIVRFDDDSSASAALISGQVDSLITTPAIAAMLAKRFPDRGYEEKFSVLKFWYGVGLARGNVDLLHWFNTDLMFNLQNGTISKINEKWFGKPLANVPTL